MEISCPYLSDRGANMSDCFVLENNFVIIEFAASSGLCCRAGPAVYKNIRVS